MARSRPTKAQAPQMTASSMSHSATDGEPEGAAGHAPAPPQPPADGHRARGARDAGRALLAQDYVGVLAAIVALVVLIGALRPDFLAFGQLMEILNQATFAAVLACGMALLLAMRELDLSVGSVYGLTAIAAALLIREGADPWLASLGAVVMGAALGLFNGLLIQLLHLSSIVATLATLSMFRGLDLALSHGTQVLGAPQDDSFSKIVGSQPLGVPFNVWVLVVLVVVLTVVLRATPFGYRVRSIGSSPEAAEFSGLPIARIRLQAFVLMGALGGLVGVLSLGYFGSADPSLGTGYELLAIASAVIGGTSLRGGKATIVGAALGAILLGVVSSGLTYFDVPINWTSFATGTVILLAVALDSLLRRRRSSDARPGLP